MGLKLQSQQSSGLIVCFELLTSHGQGFYYVFDKYKYIYIYVYIHTIGSVAALHCIQPLNIFSTSMLPNTNWRRHLSRSGVLRTCIQIFSLWLIWSRNAVCRAVCKFPHFTCWCILSSIAVLTTPTVTFIHLHAYFSQLLHVG
jgi:hypothetical protein